MQVKLIAVTQPAPELQAQGITTAEQLLTYVARVSNPANQLNTETGAGLLRYCLRKAHWSVFETAGMTVEIETSRAISAQILRHRSFTFQEFSQRYADASELGFEEINPRRQDTKNRQSSHDDLPESVRRDFASDLRMMQIYAADFYNDAIKAGIAKESARFLLPLSTKTRLYMSGNCRSWITYLQVRRAPETQLEHREVADAIWDIFKEQFPVVAAALADAPKGEV